MLRMRQSSRRPSMIRVPTRRILISLSSARRSGGSGTVFEKEKPVSTACSSANIRSFLFRAFSFPLLAGILLQNGFKKSLLAERLYPHSRDGIVYPSVTIAAKLVVFALLYGLRRPGSLPPSFTRCLPLSSRQPRHERALCFHPRSRSRLSCRSAARIGGEHDDWARRACRPVRLGRDRA